MVSLTLLACIAPLLVARATATWHETSAFRLEIDDETQLARGLFGRAGANAGEADFNFLLPTENRTGDGYLLRLRTSTGWQDISTHVNRAATPQPLELHSSVLTAANITAAFSPAPITVSRLWSADAETLTLSFEITNIGRDVLEIAGLGIPTPWNNNWEDNNQEETWTQHVITDPAPSLDAGYTITNRLTGRGPTLITVPAAGTPLEAYRLNYPVEGANARWPPAFLEKSPIGFSSEGVFSWWAATGGLTDLDDGDAADGGFARGQPWNEPSSIVLQPNSSRTFGLCFVLAPGPRDVETRLQEIGRPTIVGVPGFVVSRGEPFRLVVHATSEPKVESTRTLSFSRESSAASTYIFAGTASDDAFGEHRVTIRFSDGQNATAHYYVIKPHADQLDSLGTFRFESQYFDKSTDPFRRSPSIISYDHSSRAQVVDDNRAWVAGLSDEGGSGAYVSAAAKQYGRPDAEQVTKLEAFATRTLWGQLQDANSSSATYGAVRKSLFYFDSQLQSAYDPAVDHTGTWDLGEASKVDRSYNYPHPLVVYWVLYRLARNYKDIVTAQDWRWYLDRSVDTITAMEKHAGLDTYSGFGLMEGTYFLRVLEDLQRENWTEQAAAVESFMRARADLWKKEQYPYASEFAWDNTAQEEVYQWSRFYGNQQTADDTVETLMAIMASVPHWGYSGSGRDLWDCLYACKSGAGSRIERILHHYKGSQSSLVLMDHYLSHPDDIRLLRAGYGGILGPLASILDDGFGSSAYHTRQDYLNWDPLSGDNGVNVALYTLNARAIYVNAPEVGGHAGFGASISVNGTGVTIAPTDGIQQRLFIAPIALYLELDAGKFQSVLYDSSTHSVSVTLAGSDAHTSQARLRVTTTAKTDTSAEYTLSAAMERGAYVIALSTMASVVPLQRTE